MLFLFVLPTLLQGSKLSMAQLLLEAEPLGCLFAQWVLVLHGFAWLPAHLSSFPTPRSSHYRLSNFQKLFWFQIPFSFLSLGNLFLYFQLCGFNFLLFFYTEFLCVVCPSCGCQHWVRLKVSTALLAICLPLLATAHKPLEAGNFYLDSWVPT